NGPQFQEKNAFSNGDVMALAGIAPHGLDNHLIAGLGTILRMALDQGNTVADCLARLKATPDSGKPPLTRRQAAKLLIAAGRAVEAGEFLPRPEEAEAEDDREALNLLSRHYLALYDKEKKTPHLEKAWTVTQAVLAVGKVDRAQKDEALTRAVELAPKIRDELGKVWLDESFTKRSGRGMEILAAIGASASRGLQSHPFDPVFRQKSLELQKTAVEALLKAAPERAAEWGESLTLLAGAWRAEAEFSEQHDQSTSLGPRMQRDSFGNFYYTSNRFMPGMSPQQPNMPRPITVPEVLEARPGDDWLERLGAAVRPSFDRIFAQLYLKVGEEDKAFPFIERLAATQPEPARKLADEFLRVWTRNHDPNAERNRSNPYIFMFGFERKAESIPLTRSKQERNLSDLAGWVRRLRALPIAAVDEKLLAQAFTASHSTAEVYRLDAIESVFGPTRDLKPETLAELLQQMRGNLAGVWRRPDVQEQNKTKRREKDIRVEVLRGYEVARAVIDRGLEEHPDDWSLVLARAAFLHDENDYRQEIDPNLEFTRRRAAAFAEFQRAAQLYAARVPGLSEEDESARVYELWFYASLGACDLGQIDEKRLPDLRQPLWIRAAIDRLPGEAAGRHLEKFANQLFTRMSGLNPAVKFRYLRGGFEIVGDHKQAHEARKVFDYYKDLVTEIKLEAVVDGGGEVGHDRPFGLFVNLRHTREIERESGGFGRYLQNQKQNTNFFYYNYGRPLENYRDKFQEAAQKALQEDFEVLSVTFQDEKVHSKAAGEYGWRITPYAYLLLKARSPRVDKIAPLRLDLDFLDTSGYVILPVESPSLPIDAAATPVAARPFAKLQVTQTLDERQAKDGKLILEVKAVAQGLVPPLDQVLDVKSAGFQLAKADDQGVSVSRFDPESDATVVVSERNGMFTFQADESRPGSPEVFRFASARMDPAEMTYQRYVDADLATVGPEIRLDERYGQASRAWIGWTAGGLAVLVAAVVAWQLRPRSKPAEPGRFQMPEPLTPFSVLGLLKDIERNDGLAEPMKRELSSSIATLEHHYFAGPAGQDPDLREIAETWLRRTTP
ncbi:MAG: hypothetical protein QOE66_2166, partial [Chloroflexota bacterium]|nr:hypothetical protein [Chloroflexota bacterium]